MFGFDLISGGVGLVAGCALTGLALHVKYGAVLKANTEYVKRHVAKLNGDTTNATNDGVAK